MIEEKEIKQRIADLVKQLPKKERKPKKLPVALSEEEFVKLIKVTKHEHHKVAFLLGFGSGLRASEIIKLESRNVNLKDRTILAEQGKGSKDAVVPLPKGFRESHLKMLPIGNKCGVRALEKIFKKLCKEAGLLETKPTLHLHSLRHGYATNLVKNGVPIHHIRTLMRHSNISTTNVYLEMNPKEALKSYEELF